MQGAPTSPPPAAAPPLNQVAASPPAPLLLPVFDSPTGTTIVGYAGPAPTAAPAPPTAGDAIVVTARVRTAPGDPLQALNAKSYEVAQVADRAIVAPMAKVYKNAVPTVVRVGIRHFFHNLQEPIVALNFLLQLHPGKAAETIARFAINSTVGIAGIVDVARARPINLPRRTNGFANTLGYYGVGPGAFFFLPLAGPTSIRDLIGGIVDGTYFGVVSSATIGSILRKPAIAIPGGVARALDHRIEFDEHITEVNEESPDPYVAAREYYLHRRAREIAVLHHPALKPADTGTAPPAQ